MFSLLLKSSRSGFPAEYLVSRIHARKWRKVLGNHESPGVRVSFKHDDAYIWEDFARERRWFYLQVEHRLPKVLAPLFLYFELEALILGLRSLGEKNTPENMKVVTDSILAEELQKALQAASTPGEVLGRLEKFLAGTPLKMKGISQAYHEEGLQGCEERFRAKFYEQALLFCDHPRVRRFFRNLIDLRNIMTMAKALHWKKTEAQSLTEGGIFNLRKSERVPSETGLRKIIRRAVGLSGLTAEELQPVQLEEVLHEELSRKMARQMRNFDPVQCCCGYMWHSYMTTRKQSQEFHRANFTQNFIKTGAVVS